MKPRKKHFVKCPHCNGSKKCIICSGTGIIVKNGFFSTTDNPCQICDGLGFCPHCGGAGKYDPEKMKGKEGSIVKIRCPKCSKILPIFQKTRPLEFPCPNCGMKLLLRT